MPTLMEEIKPVVLLKSEFDYREKFKIKRSSLEFAGYQDSDAREKTLIFLFENLSTTTKLWIEILMEETKFVVPEK